MIQEKSSFQQVSVKDPENLIKSIPSKKASEGDIPIQILKQSRFTYQILVDCIIDTNNKGVLPDSLKRENVTLSNKKDEPTDKENYKPVSVLPLLSMVFERLLCDQLSEYLWKYLSTLLCRFRRAHSTPHALSNFYKHGKKN